MAKAPQCDLCSDLYPKELAECEDCMFTVCDLCSYRTDGVVLCFDCLHEEAEEDSRDDAIDDAIDKYESAKQLMVKARSEVESHLTKLRNLSRGTTDGTITITNDQLRALIVDMERTSTRMSL